MDNTIELGGSMSPEQAIKMASETGFCRLGHKVYLLKTSEAKKNFKFEDTGKPYVIVFDLPNWADVYGVTNAKDSRLVQACGVQK